MLHKICAEKKLVLDSFSTKADGLVVVVVFGKQVQIDVVHLLHKKTFKVFHKVTEERSVFWGFFPAFHHDVVQFTFAVLRLFQSETVSYVFHHFTGM